MSSRSLMMSMTVTLLTALTVSSCMEDELLEPGEESLTEQGQPIVLGKKLANPFSVANMKLAYSSLVDKGIVSGDTEIKATHWYVRFLPMDFTEYDVLKNDTTLTLADYPMDYEILVEGEFYRDPSIPADRPTYQYAAVPVHYFSSAGIAFEIMDELYLPQHRTLTRSNDATRSDIEEDDLSANLEDEALTITGNLEEVSSEEYPAGRSSSKWTPAGRIMVWDNRLGKYIPVAGAKVQARRWFDVKEAYTDESGYYKMNRRFRHAANYSIVWERGKFDIRSGTFGQARFNGPKIKGDWNVNIDRNGISFHYAHVFRAAMRYYYGNIGGLTRPAFKIKYAVFNKKGNHAAKNIGNWSAFGINPNILIYRYNSSDGTENDSDEMFSAACHETAHATHMQVMDGGAIQFIQVSEMIRESWAVGVEWYITQMEYKERGIPNYAEANYKVKVNYPTLYGFQFWNKRRNETLTSLFIDLVDRNNQRGQSFGSFTTGTVTDQVTGYTLAGIESGFLKNVYGLSSLGEELKTRKPAEISEKQIDLLLENF